MKTTGRYLFYLLWKENSRTHLFWAFSGTLAGLVLLFSGLQFYENVKGILNENSDLLDPEYIVINKQVGLVQTLGLNKTGFSDAEIRELAAQPFAEKVAPFISNLFPVSAYTENERFPDFFTDLFFEAVPDEYIDVRSEDWHWKPGDSIVPIIIPQDYLNLYNFGFAQSQGLPQVPKGVISMVHFRLLIRSRGQRALFDGKICGFSNRINTILVPYSFLDWANTHYGTMKKSEPSRVILVARDPTDPAIMKYIEDRGYDTIREKLKSSRLNIILKFIISFLVVLAAIIIGLSFLIFLLSLQLMISRSATKIRMLGHQGVSYVAIARPYMQILALLIVAVSGLALVITIFLSGAFSRAAGNWNLETSEGISTTVWICAAVLPVLLFIANSISILLSTRKICKD
ncbi:MAG: hypothetical protein ACOYXB_06205 [Bacteroidota bacterium]